VIKIFENKKPHREFRKIIQYCKMMDYDINDILEMSDQELRIWYHHVKEMTENESEFRIKTGMSLDSQGNKHKVLSIVDGRLIKK